MQGPRPHQRTPRTGCHTALKMSQAGGEEALVVTDHHSHRPGPSPLPLLRGSDNPQSVPETPASAPAWKEVPFNPLG